MSPLLRHSTYPLLASLFPYRRIIVSYAEAILVQDRNPGQLISISSHYYAMQVHVRTSLQVHDIQSPHLSIPIQRTSQTTAPHPPAHSSCALQRGPHQGDRHSRFAKKPVTKVRDQDAVEDPRTRSRSGYCGTRRFLIPAPFLNVFPVG